MNLKKTTTKAGVVFYSIAALLALISAYLMYKHYEDNYWVITLAIAALCVFAGTILTVVEDFKSEEHWIIYQQLPHGQYVVSGLLKFDDDGNGHGNVWNKEVDIKLRNGHITIGDKSFNGNWDNNGIFLFYNNAYGLVSWKSWKLVHGIYELC